MPVPPPTTKLPPQRPQRVPFRSFRVARARWAASHYFTRAGWSALLGPEARRWLPPPLGPPKHLLLECRGTLLTSMACHAAHGFSAGCNAGFPWSLHGNLETAGPQMPWVSNNHHHCLCVLPSLPISITTSALLGLQEGGGWRPRDMKREKQKLLQHPSFAQWGVCSHHNLQHPLRVSPRGRCPPLSTRRYGRCMYRLKPHRLLATSS